MEAMELRERVDGAETLEEVEDIAEETNAIIEGVVRELGGVYEKVFRDTASVPEELDARFAEARAVTMRLKYLYGVQEACKEWAVSK